MSTRIGLLTLALGLLGPLLVTFRALQARVRRATTPGTTAAACYGPPAGRYLTFTRQETSP